MQKEPSIKLDETVKQFIESYQSYKKIVKSSELGKGTTFRIVLNK